MSVEIKVKDRVFAVAILGDLSKPLSESPFFEIFELEVFDVENSNIKMHRLDSSNEILTKFLRQFNLNHNARELFELDHDLNNSVKNTTPFYFFFTDLTAAEKFAEAVWIRYQDKYEGSLSNLETMLSSLDIGAIPAMKELGIHPNIIFTGLKNISDNIAAGRFSKPAEDFEVGMELTFSFDNTFTAFEESCMLQVKSQIVDTRPDVTDRSLKEVELTVCMFEANSTNYESQFDVEVNTSLENFYLLSGSENRMDCYKYFFFNDSYTVESFTKELFDFFLSKKDLIQSIWQKEKFISDYFSPNFSLGFINFSLSND